MNDKKWNDHWKKWSIFNIQYQYWENLSETEGSRGVMLIIGFFIRKTWQFDVFLGDLTPFKNKENRFVVHLLYFGTFSTSKRFLTQRQNGTETVKYSFSQ